VTDRPARPLDRQLQVLLVYLARLPRTGVFLGALVVVLAGLFLPGAVGAAILVLVGVAMVALLTLTWPRLAPPRRIMQVVVLVLLAGIVLYKLL
jgi:hypothetical protein